MNVNSQWQSDESPSALNMYGIICVVVGHFRGNVSRTERRNMRCQEGDEGVHIHILKDVKVKILCLDLTAEVLKAQCI